MPDAQPVATVAPGANWLTAHATARRQPGAAARLPETPTTRADWRTPATAETEEEAGMASEASEGAPELGGDAACRGAPEESAKRIEGDVPSPIRGAAQSHAQRSPTGRSEHGEDGIGDPPAFRGWAECPLRAPRACPSVWQPPNPGALGYCPTHRSVWTASALLTPPPLSARLSATPRRGLARHVRVRPESFLEAAVPRAPLAR